MESFWRLLQVAGDLSVGRAIDSTAQTRLLLRSRLDLEVK